MGPLVAVAAALAMPPSHGHPVSATVQATATIRIVSGVTLRLDAPNNPDAPPSRDTVIRSADGSTAPAKLIEFQ
ncbi:MAG: hypothetical protein ACTHJK_04855 [Sphingomicrobium sp.]